MYELTQRESSLCAAVMFNVVHSYHLCLQLINIYQYLVFINI